jgi:hypothetical protein
MIKELGICAALLLGAASSAHAAQCISYRPIGVANIVHGKIFAIPANYPYSLCSHQDLKLSGLTPEISAYFRALDQTEAIWARRNLLECHRPEVEFEGTGFDCALQIQQELPLPIPTPEVVQFVGHFGFTKDVALRGTPLSTDPGQP